MICLPYDMECGPGQEPDSDISCAACPEGKWSAATSNARCFNVDEVDTEGFQDAYNEATCQGPSAHCRRSARW